MTGVPAPVQSHPERGRGLAAVTGAYTIWGFFPLLFPLLKPAAPLEILAHRVIWAMAAIAVTLVLLRHGWGWVRTLTRPVLLRYGLAAVFVGLNWLTFIWAVNNDHVVEASLGYFINPLVSIALGVLVFGETMTRGGRLGAALAFVGVVVIAWQDWAGLWVSLALATTFALYGATKKRGTLPSLEGLLLESALLSPLALAYWAFLALTGASHFGADARASGLLVLAGVLTAVPLWLFAVAVPRLPYGVVGVMQYVGPTIQFTLGLTVFGQQVGPSYWAGLVLVWLGSAFYLSSVLRRRTPTPPAVA